MKLGSWFAPAVVLVSLVGPHAAAEARVPEIRLSPEAGFCGAAQDDFDRLVDEYNSPGTSAGRREEIMGLVLDLLKVWNWQCQQFGSIFFRVAVSPCGVDSVIESCVPVVDTITDSDGDRILDLYEFDLDLDVKDDDSDDDKVLDGFDVGLVVDLVLALPEGTVTLPDKTTHAEYLAELAALAEDEALRELEDALGFCAYDPKAERTEPVCEAVAILGHNLGR